MKSLNSVSRKVTEIMGGGALKRPPPFQWCYISGFHIVPENLKKTVDLKEKSKRKFFMSTPPKSVFLDHFSALLPPKKTFKKFFLSFRVSYLVQPPHP